MHPLDMNLTSTTPRQIVPRLEDSVFRLGAGHPACTPNSESSISRSEGYFQDYAALPYFPPNEDQPISLCLVRPWNLLDLHGLVFYFILIIFEALHFILFLSPPHPRRGYLCHHWQAFTVEILYSQSSHLNLVSSKIWSVNQNTLQATMLDTRSMGKHRGYAVVYYIH